MSETPPSPRNRPSNCTTSIQKAIAEIEKELVGDIALGTRLSDDATLSAWQIRQVLWKHYDEANEPYLERDISRDERATCSKHELIGHSAEFPCYWCSVAGDDRRELSEALGFIDQTVYANDDNRPDLKWSNAEVMELLGLIRGMLTGQAGRVEPYLERDIAWGDRFGSVPLPRPRPANYIERQEP